MSRKIVVVIFLISLGILVLTAVFSINDNIYGWSDRLACIGMVLCLCRALAYNTVIYDYLRKIPKNKVGIFFIFDGMIYLLILILFCKEHLEDRYLSKDLTSGIILLIALAGGLIVLKYVLNTKRKIEKEQQNNSKLIN